MLTGSVVLGLPLRPEHLRRVRSKPAVVGFHLLFGAASVEAMAMLMRGAPRAPRSQAGPLLKAAAALLAFALLSDSSRR